MTINLNRRAFLGASAALCGSFAIIGKASAATTMTFGHGAAPGNPRSVAADKFAELVKKNTNGEVEIRVAGSEQLGNDVAMLTSLRTGSLDFTANSQGPVSGIVPEVGALGLPFLFDDTASVFKLLDGSIGETLAAKFDPLGIIPLSWWDNGLRQISNTKKSINVPDDLKGMKIRTPADPMTIDIFEALGSSTEQIAFSELYVALQQGVVDGQENPLANIASSKIYEVTPYISMSSHKWESTPFLMSKIAAARLNEDQMKVVKDAAKEAAVLQRKLMQEADEKYLKEFKENKSLTVNVPDRDALRKATASVYDKWQAKPFGDFVKELVAAAGK